MVTLTDLLWLPKAPHWHLDWPAIMAACPWLAPLEHTPQDPLYHAEGDVLTHTRMVAEELTKSVQWRDLPASERAALFLSALLHDVAKPETTQIDQDGRIESPGHARVGAAMARELLWDTFGAHLSYAERSLVTGLVRLHGLPLWFLEQSDIERAVIPASLLAPLELVAILAEADARGRICEDADKLMDRLDLFREWCADKHCLSQPFPFASDHSRVRYCRVLQVDPSYRAHDDCWGEVILMSGLPGSGKDTWLQEHGPDLPVISLDAIRASKGIDPEDNQGQVVAEAKAYARDMLRRQQSFIWNATNLSRRLRDPLIDLFLKYRARVRIVYMDVSPGEAISRNRRRTNPVPEAVIRRLGTRLEPPDLREVHAITVVS